MRKPAFAQQKHLDAFIKTAQYLASLTAQQDIWSEIGKVITNFFGADLAGFAERQPNGEIIAHHWTLSNEVSCEKILTEDTKAFIAGVLEDGFLATHQIYTPDQYSIAILPIEQETQTKAVMLVVHSTSGPLPKELLNLYLAVAGLIGTTITKLASEEGRKRAQEALRKAHNELEVKVTERTRELTQANIRLKELDRLKSMFIASMSHELRTPLNSIIGLTGIILQGISGEITEVQRKELTMVKNSANHLLALINDVIDVSKIESDQIELVIEELDLSELIQEVRDSFKASVDEKDLKMSLKTPERLIIRSDKRRAKQIIINLVSNALKFTDKGKIAIKAAKKDEGVEVSVADTGIGIKKEDMKKLFKQFSQIHVAGRTRREGTGLGLYLSKKIADLLGGEIEAKS